MTEAGISDLTALVPGTWRMISCYGESTEGNKFYPYGENAVGQLIYTDEGHMSVFLMNPARAKFHSEDISQASGDEIFAAFNSFDAYAGKWSLGKDGKSVMHHIEFGRIPNWVNASHLREIEVQGKRLILRTEAFEMGGSKWVVRVEWERA